MSKNKTEEDTPSRDDSFANATTLYNATKAGKLVKVKQIIEANPPLVSAEYCL